MTSAAVTAAAGTLWLRDARENVRRCRRSGPILTRAGGGGGELVIRSLAGKPPGEPRRCDRYEMEDKWDSQTVFASSS